MKVWVDCTAAAHPLVLRPIIERLEARGDEVSSPPASTGRPRACSTGSGSRYTVGRQPRRRLDARQGPGARRALDAAWRGWSGSGARTSRSPTARSTSPSSRPLFRIPSAQMQDYEFAGLQRKIAFRVAKRVLVPDSIPLERLRRIGAKEAQAGPLPGPQGGLLPGRLRARPRRPRRARALDREKVLVVVRPPPETSAYHARQPPLRADDPTASPRSRAAQAVVIPRTEAPGRPRRGRWAPPT